LRARALAWLAADPDPANGDELRAELARAEAGDEAARRNLADRFSGRLAFGTAGLRAELGPGPMRMREAAAGLVRHLADTLGAAPTVVIGFDARHHSDDFALDTARVVAAAGGRALLLPVATPTPTLSFAIRRLGADAGVMCTASHNPPRDNGYKVYLADGAQIIPPIDTAIAARIAEVAAEPHPPVLAPIDDPGIEHLDGATIEAYTAHVAGLARPGPRTLSIVYTPLHGVGRDVALDVLGRAGFTDVHPVVEQAEPDPDFPTVAFPNPEEPGALDLAIARARAVGADVILANDPDADRLGVVVPAPPWARTDTGWQILTGNEIGALLAEHVLAATRGADRLVVTFVSSGLLAEQAAHHGAQVATVLTGFKWVVRPALVDPARRFVFGYEEALGFSVDEYVRDKDGISAALAFASLLADLRADGRTVWDELERIGRRHGHHAARTWSVRFTGPGAHAEMAAAMRRLRERPPRALGAAPVVEVVDMAVGGSLPPTDAVVLHLGAGTRVAVRPSGTEPKVKVYVEVVVPVAGAPGGPGYADARLAGAASIEQLLAALTEVLHLASGPVA
jgi:phosphomannomutase